jgi:nitric-oxide synthase
VHTTDELAHGAKMAWRNAGRCIGRLYWRSLLVLDRRRARTADEIFSLLVHHLQAAGDGQHPPGDQHLRRGPARPAGRPDLERPADPVRGYRDADGAAGGDPRQVRFTAAMRASAGTARARPFDVLPLADRDPAEGVRLY